MTFTDEPAVLTWMIAMAPRPKAERIGRHWWRDLVVDAFRCATEAWEQERERVAIGYRTEEREFEEKNPRPRLVDFMTHLSTGRYAPERVLR